MQLHPGPEALIGPCYDTAGLTRLLGVCRQTVTRRARNNTLLAVPTDEGLNLYPASQFTPEMTVVPGIPDVLKELHQVAADGARKRCGWRPHSSGWTGCPQRTGFARTAIWTPCCGLPEPTWSGYSPEPQGSFTHSG